MLKRYRKLKNLYHLGLKFASSEHYIEARKKSILEHNKTPTRSEIINQLTKKFKDCNYLEIGVRNPSDNFEKINAYYKTSVDPGIEYKANPVDFQLTSDRFFESIDSLKLKTERKFDIIFIDGLHLADQVYKDIINSLALLSNNGFLVLHDCNPPTEWHAREDYGFELSPSGKAWNGTTWKAFIEARYELDINACCIDSDWGVGIITKNKIFKHGNLPERNKFYDYSFLNNSRVDLLNLISYEAFCEELNHFSQVK